MWKGIAVDSIGLLIRRHRIEAGMTQKQLAKKIKFYFIIGK
jgi:DNA-binding XRE family transcriptional regulator